MKYDDFEKAKVIGKVELKKAGKKNAYDQGDETNESLHNEETGITEDITIEARPDDAASATDTRDDETTETHNGETASPGASQAETQPAGPGSVETSTALHPSADATAEADNGEEPLSDMVVRFAEEDKAAMEKGQLFPPVMGIGSDPSDPRPTVKQMVNEVRRILFSYVVLGLEEIGGYLLINVFEGDFKKALSKDPYKGTSLNDLARHKDMPLSRQRLGECVRAAAVGKELEDAGLNLDSLTYYHKMEIARVRNREERLELAQEAHDKGLTVQEVRDRVRKLTGKSTSADKRLARTVIKQLGELARVSVDEDIREFLLDKDRLKAALSTGETATLLDQSEKFRGTIADSEELLQQVEKTLMDIVVERRQGEESEPEQRLTTTST